MTLPRHGAGELERRQVKNILVAIDDCEAMTIASPLMLRTIELAGAFGSSVWLVHVLPRPGEAPYNIDRNVLRHEVASEYCREHDFLQHLAQCLRDRDIHATALLVEGSPTAGLLDEAARLQAELIILGCHHHGLPYGALLEATEEGLLSRCRTPMLFVPLQD